MSIDTLDDWNQRLLDCGCCEMPTCYPVLCQQERLQGKVGVAFVVQSGGVLYRTSRLDYSGGGFWQYQKSQPFSAWFGIFPEPPDNVSVAEDVVTSEDPQTGTVTDSMLDPVDLAAARSTGWSALLAAVDWNTPAFDVNKIGPDSTMPLGRYSESLGYLASGLWCRYRWVVPSDWPGSYYKATWDEVFFPDDPQVPPSFIAQDLTAEWTGPGNPEDPASWVMGEWRQIDPPSSEGQVRVVNLRFVCYRSSFGSKPQTYGEAYEPA